MKRDVLQISFDSSNSTLYSISSFTGNWYTLTTSTGPATLGARALISGYNTTNISDLGGASATSGRSQSGSRSAAIARGWCRLPGQPSAEAPHPAGLNQPRLPAAASS